MDRSGISTPSTSGRRTCAARFTRKMPRFYCYYCDAHLTHDSPAVRKQHNTGFRHKVRECDGPSTSDIPGQEAGVVESADTVRTSRYAQANYRAYFFQFENALRDLVSVGARDGRERNAHERTNETDTPLSVRSKNEESLPELNITPEAAELQAQVAAAFQEEVNAIQGTNYSFPPPRMPGQFGPPHHGPPPGWNGPPPQQPGYGQPRYPPHGGPPHGAPPPGYGGPPNYGNGPPPRDWY